MKKVLKIVGIVLLVIVLALLAAPFLFKSSIEKQVKKAVNNNVNATVEWENLSLSLFSSFPDARLKLKGINVVNKSPFEGDTLVAADELFLDMNIPQLFKGSDQPLAIKQLGVNRAFVNVKVNEKGEANYDIAKSSDEKEDSGSDSELSLEVQHYEINDSRLNYLDESSGMFLRVLELNHSGTGDFAAETFRLETQTDALVSFAYDSTDYLNKNKVSLDAILNMDLKNMRFTFEENEALINQLPLTFEGYVQVNDDHQEMDIAFKTPTSDFKNFLGVIPEVYVKNLDNVETSGDFAVDGRIYGVSDEKHIPKLDIALKSENAYFKYPDLPKAVENIDLDARLVGETGLMEDLKLDLNKLNFKIDQDAFKASGNFKDLVGNTLVNLKVDGILNLANISRAYPLDLDMDLNGILNANMTASFAMEDIEKERYENINSSGSAALRDFSYSSEEIPNPITISKAALSFNPGSVDLKEFDMKTGETDAQLKGKIENLMGYLFKGQPVKGNFAMTSTVFSVNDFMVKPTEEETGEAAKNTPAQETEAEEAIKIPSFLDVVLTVSADKVLYDNLTLSNAKGTLILRDETATLKDIITSLFGGTIGLDGSVATKGDTPKFDVDLQLKNLDISESFKELELLKNFAPITKALVGNLSSSIKLNGDLTKSLTPIYSSLTGEGLAELLSARVEKENMPFVSNLNERLHFINFDKLNLENFIAHFEFHDGGINFEPFNFNLSKDMSVQIQGKHTFDNQVDYVMNLNLPAKYLGSEISSGLAKLSKTDLETMRIDVPVKIGGALAKPTINLDMEAATKELASRIVDQQKEELKDKAKDKLESLFGGKKDESDSTATDENRTEKEEVKEKAKEVLKGLFGGKKKSDQTEKEKPEETKKEN